MPVPLLGMLGAAALSGGMGMISADQQNKTNRSNMEWSEEAQNRLADRQMERQLQMWKKTGIAGQKAELEKAGMNAALLYGGGGSGGQSQSVGGATPSAPQGSGAANPQLENSVGMAMQVAQLKLIDAQAKKAEAEANAIPTQVDEAKSRIDLNKLEAQLQGRSLEDRLTIIEDQERIMRTQALIGENTAPEQVEKVKQELTNLAIEQVAKETGIAVDKAKIAEITAGIQQKWKELNINETKSRYEHSDRLKAIEEYTGTTLKAAGIAAAGNVISDVVKIATRQMPQQQTGGWRETHTDHGNGTTTGQYQTWGNTYR